MTKKGVEVSTDFLLEKFYSKISSYFTVQTHILADGTCEEFNELELFKSHEQFKSKRYGWFQDWLKARCKTGLLRKEGKKPNVRYFAL
jgi:hypothetical protein